MVKNHSSLRGEYRESVSALMVALTVDISNLPRSLLRLQCRQHSTEQQNSGANTSSTNPSTLRTTVATSCPSLRQWQYSVSPVSSSDCGSRGLNRSFSLNSVSVQSKLPHVRRPSGGGFCLSGSTATTMAMPSSRCSWMWQWKNQ